MLQGRRSLLCRSRRMLQGWSGLLQDRDQQDSGYRDLLQIRRGLLQERCDLLRRQARCRSSYGEGSQGDRQIGKERLLRRRRLPDESGGQVIFHHPMQTKRG